MGLFEQIRRSVSNPSDELRVMILVCSLGAIGLASLLFPAGAQAFDHGWPGALTVLGSGLFLAGAASLAGTLVGFLFGVPRSRSLQDSDPVPGKSTSPGELYRANNNLDQISDWLTKIVVGVGLTQISAIVDFFKRVGEMAGPAFGAEPVGRIIAISIVIHYLVLGFFQGFLLAYLWLPRAFKKANTDRSREQETAAQLDGERELGAIS